MLKALSDPTRMEILRIVAAQPGPVCACDIVDRFKLSQPTISHHLKTLSNAGLLISRRSGLWRFYTPDPDGLDTDHRVTIADFGLSRDRTSRSGAGL